MMGAVTGDCKRLQDGAVPSYERDAEFEFMLWALSDHKVKHHYYNFIKEICFRKIKPFGSHQSFKTKSSFLGPKKVLSAIQEGEDQGLHSCISPLSAATWYSEDTYCVKRFIPLFV
eukprot:GHVU01115077.1.p1 GENE.GHVU01115077.1~~GHVU01115077.1.p1  ORF type:complete len:116 (+),score=6.89 GHVU01115077.1:82-429(+)